MKVVSVIATTPSLITRLCNKNARSNVNGATNLAQRICKFLKAVAGHEITDEMKANITSFDMYVNHLYFGAVLSSVSIDYTSAL